MPETPTKEVLDCAKKLSDLQEADIFLFSSSIFRGAATNLIRLVDSIKEKKPNAILILSTYGGDPDAAFLIARSLRRNYKKLTALVFGLCKSAGTLVVVGAHELVMSDHAELGPLDIQVNKDDEIFVRNSGLDINEAIVFLRDLASELFNQQLFRLKAGTAITTRTAADIAQSIAIGLVTPIASQIDPVKLGEMQRAMRIVRVYGNLLCPDSCELDKLTANYPSHSFVIDREQAGTIFKSVRVPTGEEIALGALLGDVVTFPNDRIELLTLKPEQANGDKSNDKQ